MFAKMHSRKAVQTLLILPIMYFHADQFENVDNDSQNMPYPF